MPLEAGSDPFRLASRQPPGPAQMPATSVPTDCPPLRPLVLLASHSLRQKCSTLERGLDGAWFHLQGIIPFGSEIIRKGSKSPLQQLPSHHECDEQAAPSRTRCPCPAEPHRGRSRCVGPRPLSSSPSPSSAHFPAASSRAGLTQHRRARATYPQLLRHRPSMTARLPRHLKRALTASKTQSKRRQRR